MANRMTRQKVRKKLHKMMVEWGMHEDEIALCMVEIKKRQAMKNRGELSLEAPLCTRPAFRIYRREFKQIGDTYLDVLMERVLDALY